MNEPFVIEVTEEFAGIRIDKFGVYIANIQFFKIVLRENTE